MCQTISILLVLLVGALASVRALAQTQPVFLRFTGVAVGESPGYSTDLQLVGNRAYLAWASSNWAGETNHEGGLEIYGLENPSAPIPLGGCKGRTWAKAVHVVGHYAYLAEGAAKTYTNDPGLFEIIDVSDPANPVRLSGGDTLGQANAVRVVNNYAYVAESTRWTGTNLLGALEIFDVSTPTNPVRVAIFDTTGSVTSVEVSGHHAYLADGVTDLQVLDISDPGNPQRVGDYHSDATHNACGFEPGGPANFVQVVGHLAYSAGENGLHVLDISDPMHPVSVSDNFCYPIQSLHVSDQFVYATIWASFANTFILAVLDASDPTNLMVVGWKWNWISPVFGVASNLVYVATHPLSVYEIVDRPSITSLSINADSLILTWENAPGFVLQRTTTLIDPAWSDVPGSEGNTSIWLPMTGDSGFFRLAKHQQNWPPLPDEDPGTIAPD